MVKRGHTRAPRMSKGELAEQEASGQELGDGFKHNGSFSAYMAHKRAKLDRQFRRERELVREQAPSSVDPQLFRGISVFVNGLTNQGIDVLRDMVLARGGLFKNYLPSRSDVTHIVCDHLPDQKLLHFRCADGSHPPIVSTQWLLDSATQNRVLPIDDYSMTKHLVPRNQRGIKSMLSSVSKHSSISQHQHKTSANTHPAFQLDSKEPSATCPGRSHAVADQVNVRASEKHPNALSSCKYLCVDLGSADNAARLRSWLIAEHSVSALKVGMRRVLAPSSPEDAFRLGKCVCDQVKRCMNGHVLVGIGESAADAAQACESSSVGKVNEFISSGEGRQEPFECTLTARWDQLPIPGDQVHNLVDQLIQGIERGLSKRLIHCRDVSVDCGDGALAQHALADSSDRQALREAAHEACDKATVRNSDVKALHVFSTLYRQQSIHKSIDGQHDEKSKCNADNQAAYIPAALQGSLEAFNRTKDKSVQPVDTDDTVLHLRSAAQELIADPQAKRSTLRYNHGYDRGRDAGHDRCEEIVNALQYPYDTANGDQRAFEERNQPLEFRADNSEAFKHEKIESAEPALEQSVEEDVFQCEDAEQVSASIYEFVHTLSEEGDTKRDSERLCAFRELLSCYVAECVEHNRFEEVSSAIRTINLHSTRFKAVKELYQSLVRSAQQAAKNSHEALLAI